MKQVKAKNNSRGWLSDHTISNFFGFNNEISDIKTLADGWSPDELNWITGAEKDCIILRRGTKLLGQTRQTGLGNITGLGVGTRYDGRQIPFFSYGRKIKYYDLDSDDTIEVGSDILPEEADGDEVSIFPYQNLAGAFVYCSSPNSSNYKIPVANPGNAVDQNSAVFGDFTVTIASPAVFTLNKHGLVAGKPIRFTTDGALPTGLSVNTTYYVIASGLTADNFEVSTTSGGSAVNTSGSQSGTHTAQEANLDYKGFLKFGQSRSFLINRKGSNGFLDKTNLYMSWVDGVSLATAPFAFISSENLGSSGSSSYSGTLIGAKGAKTIAQVLISASVGAGTEIFLDDKSGNLSSNFGSTGTINYATGEYSVNFSDVTTSSVVASYYTEDATFKGVLDYSFATTRVAGTGRYFSQFDGGGPINTLFPLGTVFYCFHTLKTWQVTIPTDDDDQGSTPATNLPFRDKMGVTYPYSAFGGAQGIYYINNSNPNRPEVYQLRLFSGATQSNIASPVLISKALNLSSFGFDKAVMFEWGIYVLLCCQQMKNGVVDDFNSRTFLYNKKTEVWDLLDNPASRLAEYEGTLIAGDPLTNNVYTYFSGFDDDENDIFNYWTSGMTNHGITGQKVHKRMVIDGLIQAAQNIDVYLSYDGGNWVKTFTIEGNGAYVDSGKSIAVGSYTEGSKIVGGGEQVFANPFQVEFAVNSPRYEYVRIKFQATGGGYAQINYYRYKMILYKGSRSMPSRIAS